MSPADTPNAPPRADRSESAEPALKPDLVTDVLIVGGGMVGQTLAVALGGAGLSVVLIDRADPATFLDAGFDGRVSAIAAGSRAVLDTLGVWQGMAEKAEPILDIRVTEANSPLFIHFDHGAVARDGLQNRLWRRLRPGDSSGASHGDHASQPFGHIVENRAIRTALLARIAALPTIKLMAPAEVADVVN